MKWIILITICALIGWAFFVELVGLSHTDFFYLTDEDPLEHLTPIKESDDTERKD